MTSTRAKSPRILLVTTEIACLPEGISANARQIKIGSGQLADTSASIVTALFQHGANIHVALPNFRRLFTTKCLPISSHKSSDRVAVNDERVHLAQDRNLFYWYPQASEDMIDDLKISLAFQREVINHIVPIVQPDLIHCMGWMTGLVPAMARERDIPCLFSIFDFTTGKACLNTIEDSGIDAATFWHHLYYNAYPSDYETMRETIPVDFLASGLFASSCVSVKNTNRLREIINVQGIFSDERLKLALINKWEAGCAVNIDNTQPPPYHPTHDPALFCNYTSESQVFGKKMNKRFLQKKLGLRVEPQTPLFFWPLHRTGRYESRQQLCRIVQQLKKAISAPQLQLLFSGDASHKHEFERMVNAQNLTGCVAWCDASARMTRQAIASADFLLRTTIADPGHPMRLSGPNYGTLPIVPISGHGINTIRELDIADHTGNGFLFKGVDPEGLMAALDRAIAFYQLPARVVNRQIHRIMAQSAITLNQYATADQYMTLYQKMLQRPLRSKPQQIFPKKLPSFVSGKWPPSSLSESHPAELFFNVPSPQNISAQSASR